MSSVPARDLHPSVLSLIVQAQQLHEADRLDEADAAYARVQTIAPRNFLALHGRGLIAVQQARLDDGLRFLQAAVAIEPLQFDAWCNLSRAQLLAGQSEVAVQSAERAMALQPAESAAHFARAWALVRGQSLEGSLAVMQDLVRRLPEHADAWNELGAAQHALKQKESAAASFQRALQLDGGHREALRNFAQALLVLHRYEDAALALERLWTVWPECPFAGGHLLHCKMMMCDWFRVDGLRQRIEADIVAGGLAAEPFGPQGYCASPSVLRRCAETYTNALFPDRTGTLPPAPPRPAGDRIRIGYVSGELRHQATSILLTDLLETHDRTRFEIVAFDNGWDDGSELRRRIVAAIDELVPITGLDDRAAAELIRERGIDVLVNLNGFFGEARTGVFSYRPAPVQVNYLGFPGTLGAPYIDYLLADRWVVPADQHLHYREAVVTLPDCYQPNDRQRPISTEPLMRRDVGLPEEAFVFCCFNNTYKLTPEVFDVWMRLLQQVEGSVLWYFGWVPEAVANLADEARARGIDPQRLISAPFMPLARHLARLRLADLFLDTWPYNAHTTGSDALWAGLPVLTCVGPTFPSRVGASLLAAVGLPELITHSLAEYEALALLLARDPAMLQGLRQKLAAGRGSAPLFDTPRLCRHVEASYTVMVERVRLGLPPAAFEVAAQL